MTFLEIYVLGFVVVMLVMTLTWGISLLIKDSSIVDIVWGLGFVVVAIFYYTQTTGFATRTTLILLMVVIWGLRLTAYIGYRNIGKGEDFRYQKWREENGARWWWFSFFKVYALQGVILWIVSAPILAAMFAPLPAGITIWDIAGVALWGIGFFFEAVGDWQLLRFKADPANKGKLMTSGLWRYTRHPNYFGDAAVWWGHFLVAMAVPGAILTIFSPILMNYLLLRVSGVAMLEQSMKKSKPGYEEYVARTSAFIPRPPARDQ